MKVECTELVCRFPTLEGIVCTTARTLNGGRMNNAEYDDKGVPASTGKLWGSPTVEGQRVGGAGFGEPEATISTVEDGGVVGFSSDTE